MRWWPVTKKWMEIARLTRGWLRLGYQTHLRPGEPRWCYRKPRWQNRPRRNWRRHAFWFAGLSVKGFGMQWWNSTRSFLERSISDSRRFEDLRSRILLWCQVFLLHRLERRSKKEEKKRNWSLDFWKLYKTIKKRRVINYWHWWVINVWEWMAWLQML